MQKRVGLKYTIEINSNVNFIPPNILIFEDDLEDFVIWFNSKVAQGGISLDKKDE